MTEQQSNSNSLIKAEGLSFKRGDRLIFDNINIDIPRGKVTAIMGPSGCGKTTLLRLIGGQIRPNAGTLQVDGHNVPTLTRKELFELRKRMSMLFQSGALLTDLKVYENVAYPLREHTDLPDDAIRTLVLMKLEAVGLRGARDLMPGELSGGMARRVALARAIALDPMMIMYDEPFTGQDPISMGVLIKLIRLLNNAMGITSVIVSHDINETLSIADYVYILSGGKVMGKGTPQSLRNAGSDWVKQFLNAEPDGPIHFHFPADELAKDLARSSTGGRS